MAEASPATSSRSSIACRRYAPFSTGPANRASALNAAESASPDIAVAPSAADASHAACTSAAAALRPPAVVSRFAKRSSTSSPQRYGRPPPQ